MALIIQALSATCLRDNSLWWHEHSKLDFDSWGQNDSYIPSYKVSHYPSTSATSYPLLIDYYSSSPDHLPSYSNTLRV